jgi:heptosyltransferase II
MRTLVIHTTSLGDLILLTPLLTALHKDPNLEGLFLLTTQEAALLLKNDSRLDGLIVYDQNGKDAGLLGILAKVRELRNLDIERVISTSRSIRGSIFVGLCGAYERIGFSTASGALVYTDLVFDNRSLHEIDRNISLVKQLGSDSIEKPQLHDSSAEIANITIILEESGVQSPIALAPASIWKTKRWPPSHFADLATLIVSKTTHDVLLLGAKSDIALNDSIRDLVDTDQRVRVHNLAGRTSLRESYQIMRKCTLAVVNDNAPLHLAQAAGIPTFAIFGATVPEYGFGPQHPDDKVFEVDLVCRPCTRQGSRSCPINTLECLKKVSADDVFKEIRKLLEVRQ